MTSTETPTVEQLIDFARGLWACMSEADRQEWKDRLTATGGTPAFPTTPKVVAALRTFAEEIGAI